MVTLRNDPPEGVRIVVDEDDLTAMEGWVQGPGESACGGVKRQCRARRRFGTGGVTISLTTWIVTVTINRDLLLLLLTG